MTGRLYAMEKGLKIPPKERTSETKALLISLMNQLEKVCLSLGLRFAPVVMVVILGCSQ